MQKHTQEQDSQRTHFVTFEENRGPLCACGPNSPHDSPVCKKEQLDRRNCCLKNKTKKLLFIFFVDPVNSNDTHFLSL